MIYKNRVKNKNKYGCLMAMVDLSFAESIAKFQRNLISESMLYTEEDDDSYGYDTEPHCTIKFGFTPDLTKEQLREVLYGIKPFKIKLTEINQFQNPPNFDVVKFQIHKCPVLSTIRDRCDKFPNEDSYPEYNPHMTLAYVKKNSFTKNRPGLNINLPINRFKYSYMGEASEYINL